MSTDAGEFLFFCAEPLVLPGCGNTKRHLPRRLLIDRRSVLEQHSPHTQAPLIHLFIWMEWNIYKPLTALSYSLNRKTTRFFFSFFFFKSPNPPQFQLKRKTTFNLWNLCTFNEICFREESEMWARTCRSHAKVFITHQFKRKTSRPWKAKRAALSLSQILVKSVRET